MINGAPTTVIGFYASLANIWAHLFLYIYKAMCDDALTL